MSKVSKRMTIGTIVLMLLFIGLHLIVNGIADREQLERASHPRTAFQQQAVTFSQGYDARLGTPESKDEMIKVLKAAQIICAYLDEDPDLEAAWTYGTDKLDMSSDQTVVVIEEGIHAFCPRHTPLLSQGGE